jgi:hypothetical protein
MSDRASQLSVWSSLHVERHWANAGNIRQKSDEILACQTTFGFCQMTLAELLRDRIMLEDK